MHNNEPKYTDLVGAPFCYRGKSKEQGFDCWTLAREIQLRRGKHMPDYAYSDDAPEPTFLQQLIASGTDEFGEQLNAPEPWCIVFFSLYHGTVSHIGTVLPDCRRFIHTTENVNVTIERLDSPTWARRIRGYYRWKN